MANLGKVSVFANKNHLHPPTLYATGDPVQCYDQYGVPIALPNSGREDQLDGDHVMVSGSVRLSTIPTIQMTSILGRGRVMAIKSNRSIALWLKNEGRIAFCCVIPLALYTSEVGSYATNALQQLLRKAYAGWDHVFHEVFAHASTFNLKIVEANSMG